MPLSSLSDLKKNKFFISLNQQQSQYDSDDKNVVSDQFTRSPVHAVQFLIAYAGLDAEQRKYVVGKLRNRLVTQKSLDILVNDIDWEMMLKSPVDSPLMFKFTIGLVDPNNFLRAVKTKCPSLYTALNQADSIVNIDQTDMVVFTTQIAQEELWTRPFDRDDNADFWVVPHFNLSPSLNRVIADLDDHQTKTVGCFTIRKGTRAAALRVELHINAPADSNQFSIESKIKAKPGIYGAFIGLTHFYGLHQIDDVFVEIENKANFSDKGAFASQTQVTTCMEECGLSCINGPTIITVNDLNVFFQGADIVANFTARIKKATQFDPQFYIDLPTQSKAGTQIALLAQAPNPEAAFLLKNLELNLSSTQNASDAGMFSKKTRSVTKSFDEQLSNEKSSCSIL